MQTPALARQVGGNHYKAMGIQPIEFATVNRYDPGAFSVLKYVSRHERKAGREDLTKAVHFVELRLELLRNNPELQFAPPALSVITVQEYVDANALSHMEQVILEDLHVWACRTNRVITDTVSARHIVAKIEYLSGLHYPETPKTED